jgi:hypothetical protein
MEKKKNRFKKILCPKCLKKRIFDCSGTPSGEFEIEAFCPVCGKVYLKAEYIKNTLTNNKETRRFL